MLFRFVIFFLLVGCSFSSIKISPPFIKNFQPELYLGTWYEIARLPNWFEKNLTKVTATYTKKDDKIIEVLNQGYDTRKKKWKKAEGIAKFAAESTHGHLRVSFFRPFYADYFILEIDNNYQYALVGGNSPRYLWILARAKHLKKEIIDDLLKKAEFLGYEIENIEFIEQDKI